jgi:threonine/homoserine/homoserine lactone efflux protein
MPGYLILGTVYAFAAAVQPGPLQTYLISQALTQGWRRTVLASLAPILSDGPIILLVLLVLSNVPVGFIHIIQCIGGVFLLYLAAGALRTWQRFDAQRPVTVQSSQQTVFKATVVNLLNPNPYLGWSLVMGPLLLKGWRESPINGILLLVSFYSTIVLCSVGIVLLFAAAGSIGSRVNKILIGISVFALIGFGLYQLWLGTMAIR